MAVGVSACLLDGSEEWWDERATDLLILFKSVVEAPLMCDVSASPWSSVLPPYFEFISLAIY